MLIFDYMTSIIAEVKELLKQVGKEFGIEGEILLDFPADLAFGDLTTNVAMMYAKGLGRNPKELAQEIVEKINNSEGLSPNPLSEGKGTSGSPSPREGFRMGLIDSVSVAGPGFINIKLSEKALLAARTWTKAFPERGGGSRSETDGSFYNSNIHADKKILVEHSSPNLFKPFHIGHLMNNTIGESVTRLMKASGAEVNTTSFPSDISLGIAKAVYFIYKDEKTKTDVEQIEKNLISAKKNIDQNKDLTEEELVKQLDETIYAYFKIKSLIAGDAYVQGTKLYETSDIIKNEIKEVSDTLYDFIEGKKDNLDLKQKEWVDIYQKFSSSSRDYLFTILKEILGSKFDSFIYESESGVKGIETINKFISTEEKPSVFTKSEGAIVYIPHIERKDINTAVFVNSQGNPTYEAKDIGLIDLKFKRYNPDLSIFITDHEQVSHFKVVLAAYQDIENKMKENGEEVKDAAEKSIHIFHGRMQFKGQKMSSRLGGVPTAEEIISVVKEEVIERLRDEQKQDEKLANDIAIGAIKFAILRSKPGSNINFDPETSLSFEGDSGPYLMYTHARICSVLKKASTSSATENKPVVEPVETTEERIPKNWKSLPIESLLIQFPIVVEKAQLDYAPHYMVTYLLELSQEFNSWYGNTKMIDTDEQAPYRLSICNDVKTTLKEGLWMLGMSAPEKM